MPASPTRFAANAQLSARPRTPQDKARSSLKARSHGLTARDLAVSPEGREEFEQMLEYYQASAQPYDAIQQTLFEEMGAAAWNLAADSDSLLPLASPDEISKRSQDLRREIGDRGLAESLNKLREGPIVENTAATSLAAS